MSEFFDTSYAVPRGPVSPGAILAFSEDWSAWLGEDALASMTWTVPAGLTVVDQDETDGVMTVWLSGFVEGKTYEVAGTPLTATVPARKDTRRFRLVCKKR